MTLVVCNFSQGKRTDGGFALVAVLFFLLLAASILTPFSLAARAHFKSTQNAIDYELGTATMHNLFEIAALLQVLASTNQINWDSNTLNCSFEVEDTQYTFNYINHSGLIDLNAASAPLLAFGFEAIGLSDVVAERLAKNIIDFRTQNFQNASNDKNTVVVGGPKRGLFEAVEELSDFYELADIAEADLKHTFTVFSRSGTLDSKWLPTHLESFLSNGSKRNASFIVSSGARAPAFSLEIYINKNDGPNLIGRGVFAVDLGEQTFQTLEPIMIDYANRKDASTSNEQCEAFFTASTRSIIARVSH